MRRPLRPKIGALGLVVHVVAFAVAFAIRAWWVLRVQRPIDGVWSDMAGYVQRAESVIAGTTPADPRILTLWPFLAIDNVPWPEKESKVPMRIALQEGYAKLVPAVLALALVGLVFLRRHRPAALLVGAQLLTIVIVGALYLGEARHRVPYDALFIVVAVVGLSSLVRKLASFMHSRRDPTRRKENRFR